MGLGDMVMQPGTSLPCCSGGVYCKWVGMCRSGTRELALDGGGAARLRDAAISRHEQCLVRSDVVFYRLNTEEALVGVCSRLDACLKTAL